MTFTRRDLMTHDFQTLDLDSNVYGVNRAVRMLPLKRCLGALEHMYTFLLFRSNGRLFSSVLPKYIDTLYTRIQIPPIHLCNSNGTCSVLIDRTLIAVAVTRHRDITLVFSLLYF